MKLKQTSCGGYDVTINVPENYDEYAALAKDVNACLNDAIEKEVAHGTLGDIRATVEDIITDEYKVARRAMPTGVFEGEGDDRTEKTRPEPWEAYLNRAAIECHREGTLPWNDVFMRVSAGGDKEVKFDPSTHERKAPKPPTAPKWATDAATKFLATTPPEKLQKWIAHCKKKYNIDVVLGDDNAANIKACAMAQVELLNAQKAGLLAV